MEVVVRVNATKAEVLKILRSIPREATRDGANIVEAALEALSKKVVQAFVVKSRGGTDETGERWKPLAKSTVLKRLRKRSPMQPNQRPSAALSPNQRLLWWDLYRRALWKYNGDKGIAARVAWSQLKRKYGGLPLFDKYGAASVPILADTFRLVESLNLNNKDSVFRVRAHEGEFGTSRPFAVAHHKGRGVPERRLWPHPRYWNTSWWRPVLSAASLALVEYIVQRLR